MAARRDGDEFHYPIPIPAEKNSSSSLYPNPTGIKLLSHPHRVTGIISYSYSYLFSYYLILILIHFYKIIKITVKK